MFKAILFDFDGTLIDDDLGYKTVIATMPVFPGTAIRQRIEWGGIADLAYVLVTDYQTMHASKPHSAYYREIAAMIGCAPEDCVMVVDEVDITRRPRADQ